MYQTWAVKQSFYDQPCDLACDELRFWFSIYSNELLELTAVQLKTTSSLGIIIISKDFMTCHTFLNIESLFENVRTSKHSLAGWEKRHNSKLSWVTLLQIESTDTWSCNQTTHQTRNTRNSQLDEKEKSASLTFDDNSQLHTRAMINQSPESYLVQMQKTIHSKIQGRFFPPYLALVNCWVNITEKETKKYILCLTSTRNYMRCILAYILTRIDTKYFQVIPNRTCSTNVGLTMNYYVLC